MVATIIFGMALAAASSSPDTFAVPGIRTDEVSVTAAAVTQCGPTADCKNSYESGFARARAVWFLSESSKKLRERLVYVVNISTTDGVTNWYMVGINLGMGGTSPSTSPSTSSSRSSPISRFCRGEWQDDFEMQEYCQRQADDGQEKYQSLLALYRVNAAMDRALGRCLAEWWTAGGQDWNMTGYCAEKQAEAYSRTR